jgi:hypothetical protein
MFVLSIILRAMTAKAVEWLDGKLRILDQSRLPHEQIFADLDDYRDAVLAIREMKVRGAPAIGVVAAYGIALGAARIKTTNRDDFLTQLSQIMQVFAASRPTAVNLFQAISKMKKAARGDRVAEVKKSLISEARRIHQEEISATEELSRLGAELIRDGFTVLTHCNAGPLATAGYGTALGVIRALCHGNPSSSAGSKAHYLGTNAGGHPGNFDYRFHGWLFHEVGRDRLRHRGRRQDCGQWLYCQQDRYLRSGGPCQCPRYPILCCRPNKHH